MKNIKFLSFLVLTILMISSCKKNNKFDNFSILTKDSWIVKDVEDDAGNSVIQECQKDDVIQFEEKAFSLIEGAGDCSEGMFLRSGEWSFKDDGNTIKIERVMQTDKGLSAVAYAVYYYIVSINDKELVLKSTDNNNVYYFER